VGGRLICSGSDGNQGKRSGDGDDLGQPVHLHITFRAHPVAATYRGRAATASGKAPTTRVRCRISRISRSRMFQRCHCHHPIGSAALYVVGIVTAPVACWPFESSGCGLHIHVPTLGLVGVRDDWGRGRVHSQRANVEFSSAEQLRLQSELFLQP
jgi:hypothetical protein